MYLAHFNMFRQVPNQLNFAIFAEFQLGNESKFMVNKSEAPPHPTPTHSNEMRFQIDNRIMPYANTAVQAYYLKYRALKRNMCMWNSLQTMAAKAFKFYAPSFLFPSFLNWLLHRMPSRSSFSCKHGKLLPGF